MSSRPQPDVSQEPAHWTEPRATLERVQTSATALVSGKRDKRRRNSGGPSGGGTPKVRVKVSVADADLDAATRLVKPALLYADSVTLYSPSGIDGEQARWAHSDFDTAGATRGGAPAPPVRSRLRRAGSAVRRGARADQDLCCVQLEDAEDGRPCHGQRRGRWETARLARGTLRNLGRLRWSADAGAREDRR